MLAYCTDEFDVVEWYGHEGREIYTLLLVWWKALAEIGKEVFGELEKIFA